MATRDDTEQAPTPIIAANASDSTAAIAKLQPPRIYRPLHRDRLFQALDAVTQGSGAWVGAMAGAGKTTLVATWLQHRRLPSVWVQLDAGDSDPTTFFHYLSLATARRKRRRQLPIAVPEALSDLATFAQRYFRALYQVLPPDAVLVLDNFQEAECESLLRVLEAAILELPLSRNLVVVSRTPPPASMAHIMARGLLKCIRPESLEFSRQEVQLLVRESEGEQDWVDTLHSTTQGWAAGIILMVEAARGEGAVAGVRHGRRDLVFEYFAGQVFSCLDAASQDILIRTSVLPVVTEELAAKLTGRGDAANVILELYGKKLFTYRSGAGGTYQYHRLFREFLLGRLRHTLGSELYRQWVAWAAKILDADNALEPAIALSLEAEAWNHAASLIVRCADSVASQSRWKLLLFWIEALPRPLVESQPWLTYWRGIALSATRSEEALPVLEQAVHAFAIVDDVEGQLLASSEGLNCAFRLWSFTESADSFLVTIQRLLRGEHGIGDSVRVRALTGAVVGLTYRDPGNALLLPYSEELLAALPQISNRESAVRAAIPILEYTNDLGSFTRSEEIIALINSLPGACSATLEYHWWDQLTWQYCYMGVREAAMRASDHAFHCAESNGLSDLLFLGRSMQCTAAIQFGDLARAEQLLMSMRREFPAEMLMHSMRLHWLELWFHLARNDADAARRVWARWERLPLAGVPIMYPSSHPVIAVLLLCGEHQQALERVRGWQKALAGFNSPYFEFNLLLMEAAALLIGGDEPSGRTALGEAFAIGRDRAFLCTTAWIPSLMAHLCGVALTHGIEDEYVRQLIRHRRLPAGAVGAMLWPRPVKVLTLGQFCVLHDDVPLELGRKAPKKVLGLLKLILAHGGRDVPADSISDLLWPDLEGDAQHVAFSIALHRLRKLLRDPMSLRLLDGRVSLDPEKVWVDAFALDEMLNRALQCSDGSAIVVMAEQALKAYKGPFLSQHSEPWAVSIRERIRSRFVRVLEQACADLERQLRYEEAIVLYRCGIETDCLAEAFYQGLIRCYAGLGRCAEALAAFRQLEHVLRDMLDATPSAATRALAARLPTA